MLKKKIFEIAIPALRDEELISLYKEIHNTKDKRISNVVKELIKRGINKEELIREGDGTNNKSKV